jgi:hypothetical protein
MTPFPRWPAGVLLLALVMPSAADAQDYRGTPAQRAACRPDVFRLCAAEIPNVRAITACLAARISRLSPDCRAVFENRTQ